jgi:ribosomal protein S18 acetylase RimI-like enzyme
MTTTPTHPAPEGEAFTVAEAVAQGPLPTYQPSHPAAPRIRLTIATPDQFEDVLAVLNSAAAWLIRNGHEDQWPTVFEHQGWRADKIRDQLAAGNVVLVWFDRFPIATVTLTTWADPDFAHAWPSGPGDALYVLRLAVTDTARKLTRGGPGIGAQLLDFAEYVARQRGLGRVRLDCSRDNLELHFYYLRHGFKTMGVVPVEQAPNRRSGALFERTVHH